MQITRLAAIRCCVFLVMINNLGYSYRSSMRNFNHIHACKLGMGSMSSAADVASTPSGLLAIYKPKGMSSAAVCNRIKSILQKKKKIKVGHGGTLDPMAEGVLVLGVGDGCKTIGEYLKGPKTYHAIGLLGSETDSLDATGLVSLTVNCDHISKQMLEETLDRFRGDIIQVPPMFSALKQGGKRLYDLARKGIVVDRPGRPVTVYKLDLAEPFNKLPQFGLVMTTSGGFYVRSLIADIAKQCNGAAHMIELKRIQQGPFSVNEALKEENWEHDNILATLHSHSQLAKWLPP